MKPFSRKTVELLNKIGETVKLCKFHNSTMRMNIAKAELLIYPAIKNLSFPDLHNR